MRAARSVIALASILAGTSALALDPGDKVDNFRLLDHRGDSHELYYLSDMPIVVLVTQQNGCKKSSESLPELQRLHERYVARGVAVRLLNSTLEASRANVAQEMTQAGVNLPVLLDPVQLIGESLGATKSGEAFVIDTKTWTLAYRGSVAKLQEALDATLSGAEIIRPKSRAKGCSIEMPEYDRRRKHAKISYEHTIAPMLQQKCVSCHQQGGIGPWAMDSYEKVRGFAPMIREVLRTERMPPWHADPHFGAFSNDRSLSLEQTKTLVHWIEAGAPRDKKKRGSAGADPLLAQTNQTASQWALGEPDLVIDVPAFDVPASGTIAYQRPTVKNPLGKDAWLRAIEFKPTNRGVVHHILAGLTGLRGQGQLAGLESLTALGVYVPGDVPHALPEQTGVFIPKDSDFVFQMHYTANGKAVNEVTRVALYLAKEPPKFPMRNTVLLDFRLRIPAHAKDHPAQVERTFDKDVLIYTLMAHSHVRGKSSRFTAVYPDGRQEILLAVPHYDFNWQTSYELATPKLLPKGTKLIYASNYDNSVQNKANPDPTIEVRWGEQTWEEMIYGDVRFRYPDETTASEPVKISATP